MLRVNFSFGDAPMQVYVGGGTKISYWLGEPHWGKGHGTAIVSLFSYQSFRKHPNLKSIFARIHKDNIASQRVVEKSSYAKNGTDPQDSDWLIFRVRRSEFWLT